MVGIVNRANTSVTAIGGGRYRVVKTAGGDGYNASAVSSVAIPGDFVLWAKRATVATSALVAVGVDPDESIGYDTLDYAAHLTAGNVEFYQDGAYLPPPIANDGTIWIGRVGSTLTFRAGPRFATATVLRTVAGVGGAMFFDSSIFGVGHAVDIRFDAPGAWTEGRRPRSRAMLGTGLYMGGLR